MKCFNLYNTQNMKYFNLSNTQGNFMLKEENVYKINSIDISPDDMYAVISVLFHQRGNPIVGKPRSDGVYSVLEEEKKES